MVCNCVGFFLGPSCDHCHPVNSYFVAKSKIFQASSLYIVYSFLTLLSVSLTCSFSPSLFFPATVITGRHGTPSPRVLVLGHSFIRRLYDLIERNLRGLEFNFEITEPTATSWQGQLEDAFICPLCNLCVQTLLSCNFIVALSFTSGFDLEDFIHLPHDSYGVQFVCVCHTICRRSAVFM